MTDVEICNLALASLGTAGITDLEDATAEARACKAYYAPIRDKVLEDRIWSFALKQFILDPDAAAPAFGYEKRFQLPGEVVRAFRVDDGSGEYRCAWEVQGRFIHANIARAYVLAVTKVADASLYSPGFCTALALRLAAALSVPLKENRQLKADLWAEYEKELQNAAAADGAQGKSERVRSDWLGRRRR